MKEILLNTKITDLFILLIKKDLDCKERDNGRVKCLLPFLSLIKIIKPTVPWYYHWTSREFILFSLKVLTWLLEKGDCPT